MAKKKRWTDEEDQEDVIVEEEPTSLVDDLVDERHEEAAKEEPPPEPQPSPYPSQDEPAVVTLRTFSKIAGPKWDQMAGFIAWARANAMGPRTVEAWRAAYQGFLSRPVR